MAWPAALARLRELRSEDVQGSIFSYGAAITSCRSSWRWAAELLRSLELRRVRPSVVAVNSACSACVPSAWPVAWDLLGQLRRRQMAPSAQSVAPSLRWPSAAALLKELRSWALRGTSILYNSASARWRSALELLETMQQQAVPPTSVTYNACMAMDNKGWARAFQHFKSMKLTALQHTVVSYSTAIGLCASRSWRLASSVLKDLTHTALQPNVVTYTSAVDACEANWRRATEICRDARRQLVKLNLFTYNALISCGFPQWQWASSWLSQLLDRTVRPDVVSRNAAISACGGGAWQNALSILGDADIIGFNAAISACEKNQRWREAVALLAEALELRLRCSVVTFNAAISACEKTCQRQAALRLLRQLKRSGLELELTSYNAAISACENSWPEALSLLAELHIVTLQADVVSLTAACRAGLGWRRSAALTQAGNAATFAAAAPRSVASCEGCFQWLTAQLLLSNFRRFAWQWWLPESAKKGSWVWPLQRLAKELQRVKVLLTSLSASASTELLEALCQKPGQYMELVSHLETQQLAVKLRYIPDLRMPVVDSLAPAWAFRLLIAHAEVMPVLPPDAAVVLSYNLQCREGVEEAARSCDVAEFLRAPRLARERWRRRILRQLFSYKADILCLQHVQADPSLPCSSIQPATEGPKGSLELQRLPPGSLLSALTARLTEEDFDWCVAPAATPGWCNAIAWKRSRWCLRSWGCVGGCITSAFSPIMDDAPNSLLTVANIGAESGKDFAESLSALKACPMVLCGATGADISSPSWGLGGKLRSAHKEILGSELPWTEVNEHELRCSDGMWIAKDVAALAVLDGHSKPPWDAEGRIRRCTWPTDHLLTLAVLQRRQEDLFELANLCMQ
ncbi:unnamed protein product [Effrenium voratum]|uniref:Pentatricopeptide repeat-containing protein, chloroplastic n=1 Tax=Effrenium voratum TaxID=2562239 RepID=A0AA36JB26_9DINO|nr:unnamed protein product [Effrenium voratum]